MSSMHNTENGGGVSMPLLDHAKYTKEGPAMNRPLTAVLAIGFLMLASPATQAASDSGRYAMKPTDDGFIRLDTQTGAVSLCKKGDNGFSCAPVPGSEGTQSRRLDELKTENDRLRSEVERLEKHFGISPDAPLDSKPGPQAKGKLQIPTEQDVDQMFDYIEGMLKKFRDRIERLEKESEKKTETPL
jgi:hypothetical protein